jgi:hypothetical protein
LKTIIFIKKILNLFKIFEKSVESIFKKLINKVEIAKFVQETSKIGSRKFIKFDQEYKKV